MAEALIAGKPDLYIKDTVIAKAPKGTIPKNQELNVIDTFVIIILSALIFITIFSYADVVRSYIDSIFLSSTSKPVTKSRLYFSIISTIITILIFIFTGIIYHLFNRF